MIIKICGITSLAAAQAAYGYGADFIGFVFAPSRRRVAPAQAAAIAAQVPRIGRIGVFVNQPRSEVQAIAKLCRLDFVQLHGDETAEYCQSLDRPVIRALRVDADFSTEHFTRCSSDVSYFLLDTISSGNFGGSGITFDWRSIRDRIGRPAQRFLVAGGLTPENVGEAIQILQPDGVDVSGGVETGGEKDPLKICRFILAARQAAERSALC